MGRIAILPENVTEKIAAGEVIERPASVVKELIENALDASATEIEIEILGAGKRFISVRDNGTGILREDLRVAVQRHATSKVSSEEDLYRLRTLGFRGEALASVAAVSRLRILSRAKEEETGGVLEIHGGRLIEEGPAVTVGTTVEVRDLFYNTPARRKFLKSDRTEFYHIFNTVTEVALCYPEIRFILKADRQEVLNLSPVETPQERILQVFGSELVESLLEVQKGSLHLFTSKVESLKRGRTNQFIFVNRRPVRDPFLRSAIYRGYEELLPKDRAPDFFLYLNLPPEAVDFNVHPAKREVRFRDPQPLYTTIYHTVKEVLRPKRQRTFSPQVRSYETAVPSSGEPEQIGLKEPQASYTPTDLLYIGESFFAYRDGDGLTLVDQHAAHERVLYERLRKGEPKRVDLLFPRQVQLPQREFLLLSQCLQDLSEMGLEMEVFGERTLLIKALPEFLVDLPIEEILIDLAHSISDTTAPSRTEELRDKLSRTLACHRSVRGRTRLSHEEMDRLLRDLQECEDPEHCPHGRPTRVRLSFSDLRRLFKRQ